MKKDGDMRKETRLDTYLSRWACGCFLVCMLLVLVVSFVLADQIGAETVSALRVETLNTALMHLQYRMKQVEEIAYSIVSDQNFTAIMRNAPGTDYDSVQRMRALDNLLDGYLFIKADLARINVYSDYICAYPASDKHARSSGEFIWHDAFEQTEQYAAWFGAFDPRREQADSNVITYVWKAENPNPEKVVYLEIELYVQTLQSLMESRKNPSPYSNMLMIVDPDNEVITSLYSSGADDALLSARLESLDTKNLKAGDRIAIDGTKYLWLSSAQASSGYRIVELILASQLTRGMLRLKRSLLAAILVLTLALFPFIRLLAARLKRPLDILLAGFGGLGRADFSVLTERSHIREYDILIEGYNSMVLRLQETMRELSSEQKRKRDAELRALQSQINPHFLYNTLDMINWMAQEKGASEISVMTVQLSRLFRLCLSNGNSFVPLRQELEHMRLYVQIQQTRFGRSFGYSEHVDASLLDCYTPKIILQPFVENAILHGFRNMTAEPVLRVYSGEITKDSYCLIVEDNGQGIDAAEREHAQTQKGSRLLSSGYGVKNVHERIQMYFGPRYGVRLISEKGAGTRVILNLPRSMGKEEDL